MNFSWSDFQEILRRWITISTSKNSHFCMSLRKKNLRCMPIGPTINKTIIWNGTERVGFGSHDYSLAIYCWKIFIKIFIEYCTYGFLLRHAWTSPKSPTDREIVQTWLLITVRAGVSKDLFQWCLKCFPQWLRKVYFRFLTRMDKIRTVSHI